MQNNNESDILEILALRSSFTREENIQEFMNFAVPRTPKDINHAILRLYGEIIADWHGYIKKVTMNSNYSCMDMDLHKNLQPRRKSYMNFFAAACDNPDDENPDYDSEVPADDRYVRIFFNDPAIIKTIDEEEMTSDGRSFYDLRIINPLDNSVLAEGVDYDPTEEKTLYSTRYYHIETEGDELRSLIHGLMTIVFTDKQLDFADNESDILETLALRSSCRLSLAMMVHPRLNSDSLFRLLEPSLVRIITEFSFSREGDIQEFINFAVPRAPRQINHTFLRLYGEIVADWHNCIKKVSMGDFHSGMDMDLHKNLQSVKKYYMNFGAAACNNPDDEYPDYYNEVPAEERFMKIFFNDPAIVKMIDIEKMTFNGRDFHNLRVINPLDNSVLAEGVVHDPKKEDMLYCTQYFHIETKGDELRSLIHGLMTIAFADEQLVFAEEQPPPNGCTCPQCGCAVGEGGIPDALCISCERARDQV